MKATVNKTAIVKALSDLSGAISSRTTLPILGNVKLKVEAGKMELEATDLDLYVRSQIPVEESTDGETTLPAKRLLQLLREIPTDVARIEIKDDAATVTSGGSKFKLHGLPADEFPEMANNGDGVSFELSGHELTGSLKRTAYASSTDESRYVLNGILLQDSDQGFNWVATDGRRLAVAQIDGPCEPVNAIIPNKAVAILLRATEATEIVSVTIGDGWAEFDAAGVTIQTKLIEGNFPNWKQVMPGKATATIEINREDLLDSVKRVGLMVNERTNAIVLEFGESALTLSATSPDVGEARESVECVGKAAIKTAVNPVYLQQCLAALNCDKVKIDLIDENSPLSIRDQNFVYVVMPMRS